MLAKLRAALLYLQREVIILIKTGMHVALS